MENQTKISLGIVVASVVILGAIVWLATSTSKVTKTTSTPVEAEGWSKGPEDAPITIVEFADFECPACAAAQPALKQVLNDYDGKIRYYYRHYPLPYHKNAVAAANAAEAAGEEGKFFDMAEKLFETQKDWTELSDPTDYFKNLAKEIGVDENKVADAIKNNTYKDKIDKDANAGDRSGLTATPTFFVNGDQQSGVLSIDAWKELIESKLSK